MTAETEGRDESGTAVLGRRIGNWRYERGVGWRLDGTDLVLDYDHLNGSASVRGCYVLSGPGIFDEPIDHFLDASMAWVEKNNDGPADG